jgi:hypothetical protein
MPLLSRKYMKEKAFSPSGEWKRMKLTQSCRNGSNCDVPLQNSGLGGAHAKCREFSDLKLIGSCTEQ